MLANPYKAMQAIAREQRCGMLLVTAPGDDAVGWKLYLGGKRLHYATTTIGQVERMSLLWQQHSVCSELPSLAPDVAEATFLEAVKFRHAVRLPDEKDAEYTTLCHWQRAGTVHLPQFKLLLERFSQEALIQVLSLEKARVKFYQQPPLEPLLLAVPLSELIKPAVNEIRQWQMLHVTLPSPHSRLYLEESHQEDFFFYWGLEHSYRQNFGELSLAAFTKLFQRQLTLYEIARATRLPLLEVAQMLQPLLETNTLRVLSYNTREVPQQEQIPITVACIDDSQSVQRQIKLILEAGGYQVLSITNPTTSLSSLVRQKPALILLDINMPDINGYELCGMLRQSRQLRDVPIVMLTSRDGIVDRLRAQVMGVVSYLTKPVDAEQLLEVIHKGIRHRDTTPDFSESSSSVIGTNMGTN